jgi:hypothetical protein
MTIYVQQRYIPKSAPLSLNTYIEIAPELQQRGISLDESIPASEIVYRGELEGISIRGFRDGVAVMRFDNGAGQSFNVGLRRPAKILIAKVFPPLGNESLEDVFSSLKLSGTRTSLTHHQTVRGRNWENCSDRIVWEGLEGIGNISIAVKRQMISDEKRFFVRLSGV